MYDSRMDSAHTHSASESNAAKWDKRHSGQPSDMWSGHPNETLLAETSGLAPGRAVDIGCGEGADAIWLASHGWQVTGVDISQVALERAASNARENGVSVEWICTDVTANPPTAGGYELVSAHYPALLHSVNDAAIEALLTGVSPGGTLLVVGHAPIDPEYAISHGFNPDDYIQPADVAARLDESWTIEVDETRPRRPTSPGGSSPHDQDTVLKARRNA
ncbi:MAG: class I SAM-dependent methyltransferase [Acidimicrobiia bacterium]|nr:MAG: class I SAM-dependent methyltransferase [Acidimicrobiia bacterium]